MHALVLILLPSASASKRWETVNPGPHAAPAARDRRGQPRAMRPAPVAATDLTHGAGLT